MNTRGCYLQCLDLTLIGKKLKGITQKLIFLSSDNLEIMADGLRMNELLSESYVKE